MKRIIAIPCDQSEKNQKFLSGLLNSLKKFNPEIEVRVFDNPNPEDKNFWYRSKALIATQLFKEGYEEIGLFDADQVILGDISEIFDGDFDIASVANDPTYPIGVWDIGLQFGTPYFNNGLVVLKSKEFAQHWNRLNHSAHFDRYQFREQDTQNILVSDYFNYKNKPLDGEKIYGEFGKPFWPTAKLVDGKVMMDVNGEQKQLVVVHWGGGANDLTKGNYRLKFSPEMVKYIEEIIK